jgi:4-oxalocrotonate tautomerase
MGFSRRRPVHNGRRFRNARGVHMPTIRVEMFEGRSPDQKRALVQALTQAVVDSLGARPESVDVILYDIKKSEWATAGQLWSDKPA